MDEMQLMGCAVNIVITPGAFIGVISKFTQPINELKIVIQKLNDNIDALKSDNAAQAEAEERRYWESIPYGEAVDAEIRKRYSISQEFAVLRQKSEKPDEYAEYYAYCESCKALVKEKKGIG